MSISTDCIFLLNKVMQKRHSRFLNAGYIVYCQKCQTLSSYTMNPTTYFYSSICIFFTITYFYISGQWQWYIQLQHYFLGINQIFLSSCCIILLVTSTNHKKSIQDITHLQGSVSVVKAMKHVMERAKFPPLVIPKPLNWSSPILACVITSWTAHDMHNFVVIGLGVSAPQIRDFAVPFDATSFYVRFLGVLQ